MRGHYETESPNGAHLSTLFLFGAGASFGSGPGRPNNPPLGKDLFTALASDGAAALVPDAVARIFNAKFEVGMGAPWDHHQPLVILLVRHMAIYFSGEGEKAV